jgi:hypothetical protein
MRHVYYPDRPAVGHQTNWGGLLTTLLFIAAFAYLVWWLVGLIQGDAALFDWFPGT